MKTKSGASYVETFPWRDEAAMNEAHELEAVQALWGPMGDCCTSMEFPSVTKFEAV